ncbi:MAG: efflux RND transporter periplasmic adaptor subunit [Pontibacterium sp.]
MVCSRLYSRAILSAVISLSTLLVGCQGEPPTETETLPPRIAIAPLQSLLQEYILTRPASVLSLNDSLVSAQLNANVEKVPVKVGQAVNQGDLLVELNCQDQKSRLKQTKAQLAANVASVKLSQLELERAQKMYAKRSLSKQTLDSRQSEHTRSKAELRNTQALLEISNNNVLKCRVNAPFSGVVTQKSVSIGQLAQEGTVLVRLVDTQSLEVSAHLTANEVVSLRNASKMRFEYQASSFVLKLDRVTPVIDTQRRTQEVRLSFMEDQPLPGASGQLVWQDAQPILPAEYISIRNAQPGLLYVDSTDSNTKANVKFYPLPNILEGQPVVIRFDDKLTPHTKIITAGRFGVSPGDAVTVASTTTE